MSRREVVEVPGALRAEERFAFKEDAKGVQDRIKAAAKAEAEAPQAAAEASKAALEDEAEMRSERAKEISDRRVQRARAILGDEDKPKAAAVERRPKERAETDAKEK